MLFKKIPTQIKKQGIYEILNLHQLVVLSKIDRESSQILRPIIQKKQNQLFLKNFTRLYRHKNDHPNTTILQDIYNSYGGDEILFFDFLFKYYKSQVHTQTQYVIVTEYLLKMDQHSKLLGRFLRNHRLRNFYINLPKPRRLY